MSAFPIVLGGVSLFGSGTQFFCKQYRIRICGTDFPRVLPISLEVGPFAFLFRTKGLYLNQEAASAVFDKAGQVKEACGGDERNLPLHLGEVEMCKVY
jgi:hypothetical protein